jgi:DNA-directed RNA polymerase subunit RPC12/RpoP
MPKETVDDYYLVCPYCGHKDGDAWDHDLDESPSPVDCGGCGKEFVAWEERTVNYCAKEIVGEKTKSDTLHPH